MAKFYGVIGYGTSEETKPDVWEKKITERKYYGDLIRNTHGNARTTSQVNDDVRIANEISIVADPFAYANFRSMLYVEYMGVKWKVTDVEIQRPRLILTTGGVYNGKQTSTE